MIFAAVAQAIAFDYKPYVDIGRKRGSVFKNIGNVLNVNDVLRDAHNTFIKG